jgi:hypothetical protein
MVAVQVGVDDVNDLAELAANESGSSDVTTVRPFDGTTAAQLLVPLVPGGFAFFRVWVKARVETRKSVKIVKDGIEYTGLSDGQIDRVLDLIERELADGDEQP